MKRMNKPHYAVDEKIEIFQKHGVGDPRSRDLAKPIDDCTYIKLDAITHALQEIRKGKE